MRVKLGLTEEELMKSSWISLQLQMYDYPYWDARGKKVIRGKEASAFLDKYVSK